VVTENRGKEIFMVRQDVSRPLRIREFFPTGGGVIKIKDEVKQI